MKKQHVLWLVSILSISLAAFILSGTTTEKISYDTKTTTGIYEKKLKWKRHLEGVVVAPADENGEFGFVKMISAHKGISLAMFKYEEHPTAVKEEVVYFQVSELDGVPIAENFIPEPEDRLILFGGTPNTNIKFHAFYGHDHGKGKKGIHKKLHLVGGNRDAAGNVTWEVKESGDPNTFILNGGSQYWNQFGELENQELFIQYDEGFNLEQLDSCHRHGQHVEECVEIIRN